MFSQEVWLIPIIYIVAFITIITVGKSMKQGGAFVNAVFSMLAFVLSVIVLVERLQPHTLDYSFHLDWLVIGEVYYTIGYEITNLTTWLLTLISGVYFFIHIMAFQKRTQMLASSIYAYMSLFMFGLSGLLLADSVLTFYIGSVLVSSSVYLMLAHPSFACQRKLIWRYVWSQLLAHTAFLVAIVVLYWYMPDKSLQFTMLQNVFGGQAEQFTTTMLFWLSISIVASVICFTGLLPYLNWLKLVRDQQPMVQLLISTLSFVIVPIYMLIVFSDLVTSSPIMVTVCTWLGLVIVLGCTIRLLADRAHAVSYYAGLNIGLLLFAYGHHAYGFMVGQLTIWLLAIIIVHTTVLRHNNIIMSGAFLIAALTLVGVPPLSGYWLQQSLVATIFAEHKLWFVPSLLLLLCFSLSSTVIFLRYSRQDNQGGQHKQEVELQSNQSTNLSRWAIAAIIVPAIILIFSGLFWLLRIGANLYWLLGERVGIEINLTPIVWSVIVVGIAVILGWLYSERLSGKVEQHFIAIDEHMNKFTGSVGGKAIQVCSYIVQFVATLEHILHQLCTVWLLYPLRRMSQMSANTTVMRSTIWLIIIVAGFTALYTWIGRG